MKLNWHFGEAIQSDIRTIRSCRPLGEVGQYMALVFKLCVMIPLQDASQTGWKRWGVVVVPPA